MTDEKTILVTGGAGFIGSFLCESLLEDGHIVICLDNFHTGSKKNIAHLLHRHKFEVVRHDVTTAIALEVDEIYNLACPASPIHYQFDPVKTVKTNVMGALNILELARHTKARVLQASTSEVYGDPAVHPQPETYQGNVNPIGPRACYDEGKRCAETLFFDYRRQFGLDLRVARIFNTYGPRMRADDGRVVSNFAVQALRGEPLTLYGSGLQTRSFCYVSDLVVGLKALMAAPVGTAGPINLGNPVEFTMVELAELVIELANSSSPLVYMPLPQDDPRQRKPDITQATERLGWRPTVPLREGLGHVIAYFDAELGRARPALRALDAAMPVPSGLVAGVGAGHHGKGSGNGADTGFERGRVR
ncbi:UDP-glucuronic acid decarboxylase family protein [Acuticoccus kandeliae]|uniref:UDP-glucuronic acid decarboxylase family protein n=1 Tax=Acuticoccus kandeliae TaxID=2073160 RepID=UPI000D3E0F69|nr:UDP-glucuronic acid decarboxylase family protein [Acuticoccus kandeliae]